MALFNCIPPFKEEDSSRRFFNCIPPFTEEEEDFSCIFFW
jgi:hypothetical protein